MLIYYILHEILAPLAYRRLIFVFFSIQHTCFLYFLIVFQPRDTEKRERIYGSYNIAKTEL